MAVSSSRIAASPSFGLHKIRAFDISPLYYGLDFRYKKRRCTTRNNDDDNDGGGRFRLSRIAFCISDPVSPIRRKPSSRKSVVDNAQEWRFETKKKQRRVRMQAMPSLPFASPRPSGGASEQRQFYPRCTPRNSAPQSRDTPPKRDTGIANEKDWGISLLNENTSESGINEDGSTWFRESGEDLGENGYRCRWTRMGGQCQEGSSQWKETWWEKSDWTGYKELGVEKSGKNAEGDSWWETWQEVLHQDEWSSLARIERSAEKQAKSGSENAGWYEKWWEKYDAKGSTEKGAHKYGRLNEQSWWEKWGEHYDGTGSVLKWTDKWAETELGTKWGDKWEERFVAGIGSRQGETWHVSPAGERSVHIKPDPDIVQHLIVLGSRDTPTRPRSKPQQSQPSDDEMMRSDLSLSDGLQSWSFEKGLLGWSRTWGEEHFGNGKVHKYGKSTTTESWDIVVDAETYYEAEPHYGWADVVGDSSQLLSIKPRERPPGVFPNLDFGSPPPPRLDEPPPDSPSQ